MSGWIKLHRRFEDWQWSDKPEMVSLFINLLLSANYENTFWHGKPILRGQVVFGLKVWELKTGISQQSLRTCIKRLKSTGEITTQTFNTHTLITIVKYDDYQSFELDVVDKSTGEITINQQSINNQSTTYKEFKNIRSKEVIVTANLFDDTFLKFWDVYPKKRKGTKDDAYAAWQKAIKLDTPENILNGAIAYSKSKEATSDGGKYAKGTVAWLNGKRWTYQYEDKKIDSQRCIDLF